MKVLCRADASHFLGTGHVMRQLTLADALRNTGVETFFVCRTHPGHLAHLIRQRGFDCVEWPIVSDGIVGAEPAQDALLTADLARQQNVNWIFVDHYGLDAAWEAQQPVPVMAMDDMFDRPHQCQILLNQNLGASAEKYANLAPISTKYLMGTEYTLLRPEFSEMRATALRRRGDDAVLSNILVSMGGADQPNATGWVLGLLSSLGLPKDVSLTIVMGPTAPHLQETQARANILPWDTTVLTDTSEMAQLMVDADLAIGAAGSTSWERCALGLPTMMVVLAENQQPIASALTRAGAARSISFGEIESFKSEIAPLLSSPELRRNMARRAAEVVDGRGTDRVVRALSFFQSDY